jgi:hypothetical protein
MLPPCPLPAVELEPASPEVPVKLCPPQALASATVNVAIMAARANLTN